MTRIPKVILLVETSRAFGREILHGVARYSRTHGPWAFYREPGGLQKSVSRLKDWGADGIIMRNPKRSAELIEMGLPTIVVIHQKEDRSPFPRVVTDGKAIAHTAAQHLLERGFRYFGFCGLDEFTWSQERGESFRTRLAEEGYDVGMYEQPTSKQHRSWENEQRILASWLESLAKPVGVLTCNDDRGLHVLEACKIAGLRVPDEVAVMGVDNDQLVCDLSDPPMSSVALNAETAGYEAAELLDRLMSGEKMAGQRIGVSPTHVAARQSTDILAIDDREVIEAMRYIRSSAKYGIRVNDVAEAAALSRRVLEKRFRKTLNRSVHEEIKRVCINQIVRLLVETDLTISQIAERMGFPRVEHIARYFRQEQGMSLLAYRKKFGRRIPSDLALT